MPIFQLRNWARGLWFGGDRAASPPDSLRVSRNTDHTDLQINEVRSRNGSVRITARAAHSIYRYHDMYYYGVGTDLYRGPIDGSTPAVLIWQGLSGERLTFMESNPVAGFDEAWLFIADELQNIRVHHDGTVAPWGIRKPESLPILTRIRTQDKQIASFDGNDTTEPGNVWGSRGDPNFFIFTDTNIKVTGTGSHRIQVYRPGAVTGIGALFNTPGNELNLAELDDPGDLSSDQDYITAQVRIQNVDAVERIMLYFDDTAQADFARSYYVAAVTPVKQGDLPASTDTPGGLADLVEEETDKDHLTPREGFDVSRSVAATAFPIADDTWTVLRVPKAAFAHVGAGGDGWQKIRAINILFKVASTFKAVEGDPALPGAFIWVDEMRLEGGAGMVGRYKYQFTFRNSKTGSRGNPPDIEPLSIERVLRHRIGLSNLPQPPFDNAEADRIEIWRTIGNGERYFKIADLPTGTSSYIDLVSDFAGFHNVENEEVMTSEELPLDNHSPSADFDFWQTFGPHAGRAWWLDQTAGNRGHLYYSAAGRIESVEGFVNVTGDDDQLYRIMEFNGRLYVASARKWFEVVGSDEPFIAYEVWGVPGIPSRAKWTAATTPRGICFEAEDGPRIFDGARASLIGRNEVLPVFRGQAITAFHPAFSGTLGAYGRGEWLITDGNYILAYNVETQIWRQIYLQDEAGTGTEPPEQGEGGGTPVPPPAQFPGGSCWATEAGGGTVSSFADFDGNVVPALRVGGSGNGLLFQSCVCATPVNGTSTNVQVIAHAKQVNGTGTGRVFGFLIRLRWYTGANCGTFLREDVINGGGTFGNNGETILWCLKSAIWQGPATATALRVAVGAVDPAAGGDTGAVVYVFPVQLLFNNFVVQGVHPGRSINDLPADC
jgi:hypothetical protein